MKHLCAYFLIAVCAFAVPSVDAQEAVPPQEMEIYKDDVGTWDCDFKMYSSPDAEPTVSKATETNRMLGGMWLISDFKGELFGQKFEGAGQFGYNAETKKYVGSWVDSMSPSAMCMEGTWDAATKTMTNFGVMKDPTGNESRSKSVVVYKDKDNHTMTMFMEAEKDNWVKMFEIVYKRKK